MSTTILTDTTKEAVDEAVAAALGDAYDCLRVWDAWSYGTMGPDDFSLVAEDSDRLREITDAAIQAILQSPEIQAWKRDAERMDWLADQEAQVQSMNKARGDPVYRIGWPDDGEYRFDWHSSPREAIDAAMEKQP
ncbi:hypothetical protein H0A70_07905 [Alcaligenaceae bacterium]|nr:hypothetical protein [Alcaligenaceae bacterium]